MSLCKKIGEVIQTVGIYKWPIVGAFAWAVLMSFTFGISFWKELATKLGEEQWWVENAASFAIFSFLVSGFVVIAQIYRDRREKEKYEGWRLHLMVHSEYKPQNIYWEDVRRNEVSEFELWKFVKSAVSNSCRLKTQSIDHAKRRNWLQVEGRDIIIDFSNMCQDDIQEWYCDCPVGWMKNPAYEDNGRPLEFIRTNADNSR